MSVGLCSGSRSAKIAAAPISTIHAAAHTNSTPRRRFLLSAAMTDPRIEHGVEHIDDEVHDHEAHGHEQHDALQDDEVAGVDCADQESTKTGQREDRLDDQRAADQPADVDAG